MSAIAGIFHLDGQPVEPTDLRAMLGAMAHRGPDGSGMWVDDSVGLGHLMLWTTEESLEEQQPVRSERYTLVADARIDNRDELSSTLRFSNPAEASDSEFILRAFEHWGEGCLEHLIGSFAFVVWDATERRLFCARDHLGSRSFFFHYAPGELFAFATEPKGLLALAGISDELNETKIADTLLLLTNGEPEATLFRQIRKLPPACRLRVDTQGLQSRQYWTVEPKELGELSDTEYVERFSEIFRTAVECRLRSAFPVGVQLSGGLDSSFVACMARDVLKGRAPLHAYSAVFDKSPDADERTYIDEVVQTGGMIPHQFSLEHIGPLSNLEEEYDYIDTGLIGGAHHLIWNTYRKVGQSGTRVLLDGIDGDTTVYHSWTRLSELARDGAWRTFAREALQVAQHFNASERSQPRHDRMRSWAYTLHTYGLPELDRLADDGRILSIVRALYQLNRELPNLDTGVLARRYLRRAIRQILGRTSQRDRASSSHHDLSILNDDFAVRTGARERIERFGDRRDQATSVRERHLAILRSGIIANVLDTTGIASGAFSLETRHPFFDKRLVEFCVSLPADQLFRDGWSRLIMRRAMDGVVPEKVRWRSNKASIQAAYRKSLFENDGPRIERILDNPEGVADYISRERLRELDGQREKLEGTNLELVAMAASLHALLKRYESPYRNAPEAHGVPHAGGVG